MSNTRPVSVIAPRESTSAPIQLSEKTARKPPHWLGGIALMALLGLGVVVVRSLNALPTQEFGLNLSAMLEQNTQHKYMAALTVVQEESPETPGGRRSIITHQVAIGDTIASVAERYNLSTRAVVLSNRLTPEANLLPGQKLMIPPVGGILYRVEARDTLASIAEHFAVSAAAIVEATGLILPDFLASGQWLVIPESKETFPIDVSSAQEAMTTLAALSPRTQSSPRGDFIWPVQGYVGSPYGLRGGRFHAGVDIPGPIGSPVVAAKTGIVIFAGWMHGGFGNAVDILHSDGLVSRYAHLSRVFARSGQQIERGQTLGARGCTGRCTGPHLHFEIHSGGRAVNPLHYLR